MLQVVQVKRLALLSLALLSCNRWVRPTPPEPQLRTPGLQEKMRAKITVSCDAFGDDTVERRSGSGVIVSDWQVLTALHVVDCPNIPIIHVLTDRGRWRFSPEKEWRSVDVARIQMASADDLGGGIVPPTLSEKGLRVWDAVYIQTASPRSTEVIGQVMDSGFGGSGYGGTYFSYRAGTEHGNSGSGVYDTTGNLIGVHIGRTPGGLPYAAYVTPEMVPHR